MSLLATLFQQGAPRFDLCALLDQRTPSQPVYRTRSVSGCYLNPIDAWHDCVAPPNNMLMRRSAATIRILNISQPVDYVSSFREVRALNALAWLDWFKLSSGNHWRTNTRHLSGEGNIHQSVYSCYSWTECEGCVCMGCANVKLKYRQIISPFNEWTITFI